MTTVEDEKWKLEQWTLHIRPGVHDPERAKEPEGTPSPVDRTIEIGERFTTRLQLLWTYTNRIGAVAQATATANTAALVMLIQGLKSSAAKQVGRKVLATAELELQSRRGEERRHLRTSVPVCDELTLKTLNEHAEYNDAAVTILNETSVQQLVNAFEQMMAELVRDHIGRNVKAAAKDQTITYQELLEYGSLEEAQRKVVETQVTNFVRNNSTKEHLAYLRTELGIDLRQAVPGVDLFKELVLRRHAIVHAGGVATADYRRKAKEIDGIELPPEGEPFDLGPSYVLSRWDVVYALGVVTIHLAGVQLARRAKDKDAEDEVDTFLNTAGLWAVQNGRHRCAIDVFGYASKLTMAKDTCQRMVSINLAQALKWCGDEEGCRRQLGKHDWKSASSVFRLAVEVLNEGTEVEKWLKRAADEEQVSIGSVYSWPLFQRWRSTPEFRSTVERVFGAIPETDELLSANVLSLDSSATVQRIQELAAKAKAARLPKPDADKPLNPAAKKRSKKKAVN